MAPRLAVVAERLSIDGLGAAVEADTRLRREGCGALCSFLGVVRATHRGRRVTHIEYEAYEPLAMHVFGRIRDEIAARWPAATIAIHHRIGRLEVGEASVAIVAAAAHRAESFQVCRYAIERIKQVAPIWKHEFFDGGQAWVEGAVADPDDEAARRQALETACA
jgi:molybdopterin synthase catalytic subunit